MKTIEDIISHFNLQPHPEGGYFRETYRSELSFETDRGHRSACTSIYFLITKDSISHFHKLTSDEGWHFHLGAPLQIIEITPTGELLKTALGADFKNGEKLQHHIPAGHWFASTSFGDFSFVGCTVSPGFDFKDFEMARKTRLLELFANHRDIIERYSLE